MKFNCSFSESAKKNKIINIETMKKIIQSIAFITIVLLSACSGSKAPAVKYELCPIEEMDRASKSANIFFDSLFDASIDRDPVFQTRLGIKKDYDK